MENKTEVIKADKVDTFLEDCRKFMAQDECDITYDMVSTFLNDHHMIFSQFLDSSWYHKNSYNEFSNLNPTKSYLHRKESLLGEIEKIYYKVKSMFTTDYNLLKYGKKKSYDDLDKEEKDFIEQSKKKQKIN